VDHIIPLDVEVSFLEMQLQHNTQPESLLDSVRFRAPGVGAGNERPLDPCVARANSGHLGLWEEVALGPLGQNATASTQRLARSYRPATNFLESVSARVTGLSSDTAARDESSGSPAGAMFWQSTLYPSGQVVSRELDARRGQALTTPVTTSVPTQTTTSVLFSRSISPVTTESGAAIGIYTRAGVTWSTASTTSVFGPFQWTSVADGRRENTEEPSSSSQVRSARMISHTAAKSYDYCTADGWDPTGLAPRAYTSTSERHATQPYGASSTVRPRSVDSVTDTPVDVGQNIFVPRLPTDQTRHSTPVGTVNMFSNSTEYGKSLDGVRHSSIHSDPRCL